MLRGWTLGRCQSAPEGRPEPALVSPEDLELLLLSFRFPGKFGDAGDCGSWECLPLVCSLWEKAGREQSRILLKPCQR